MLVQVYTEPLRKRHYASVWASAAAWYRFLGMVAAIVLSYIVAYSTGSFWTKHASYFEQPAVRFTRDLLVVVEGDTPGSELVWSSFPDYNARLSNVLSCEVQSTEQDVNFDGLTDLISVTIKAHTPYDVHGVKLVLGLQYRLVNRVQLTMQSLAYAQYSSHQPGASLTLDGEVRLKQRNLLGDKSTRTVYDSPALNLAAPRYGLSGSSVRLGDVFSDYLWRNETTSYENVYSVWESGGGDGFTITAQLRVPPAEEVRYRPDGWETCKGAWIQFLSIFAVFFTFLVFFDYLVFHFRVLPTQVVCDAAGKPAKF